MAGVPFDQMQGQIWYNGEFVDWSDAKVHVLTHGLHYGSCVFEGERAYGGAIFKSREHTERLHHSASVLDFEIPYSVDEIENTLGQVAALPPSPLLSQFGPEGKRIHELAKGQDDTPLYPRMMERFIEESATLSSVETRSRHPRARISEIVRCGTREPPCSLVQIATSCKPRFCEELATCP